VFLASILSDQVTLAVTHIPFFKLATAIALSMAACLAISAEEPAKSPGPLHVDLSCALSTNCVSSIDNKAMALTYEGAAERGLELLRSTLGSFPEAQITRAEGHTIEAIFTTRMGFRDQVDFHVDPRGGHIDYRSRSLFGLYDWGKNRSRMEELSQRFRAQALK
jgi:uncharacterized protein (DUF1499 family)